MSPVDAQVEEREDDGAGRLALGPCARKIAVVGWTSFLAASVATMLFFAWIDPATLADVADAPLPADRMTGYAIGFFFFWTVCAVAAALAVYVLCNGRSRGFRA